MGWDLGRDDGIEDRKTRNLGQAKLRGDLGRKNRQLHPQGSS